MSYRRSATLSWLILAIVVLFLVNLQAAAAQPPRPTPSPIGEVQPDQPITPTGPEKMLFQPPEYVSSFKDLHPPKTRELSITIASTETEGFNRLEDHPTVSTGAEIRHVSINPQHHNAININNGRLGVIVEKDSFPTPVQLEITTPTIKQTPPLVKNTRETARPPQQNETLMKFQLEMIDAQNQPIESFGKQVRLVVDLGEYNIDLEEVGGTFYLAYEDEDNPGEWHEVETQSHDDQGLISADVEHFSDWEAGWRPDMWTLQWAPPTPDLYTGSATYQYPFELPPGRNGLTPSLGLSYSSSGLRGLSNRGASFGSVATAWQLSNISITRTGTKLNQYGNYDYPNTFRLTFNGKGGRLIQDNTDSSLYYVEDQPALRVYNYNGTTYANGTVNNYWIVKDGSGNQYRLGYTPSTITLHDYKGPSSADDSYSEPNILMWHVDTLTDAYGNQINYDYVNHQRISSPNPLYLSVRTQNKDLSQIRYNFPTRITDSTIDHDVNRLGDTATAGTRIEVNYTSSGFLENITIYHGNQTTAMRRYVVDAETDQIDNIALGGNKCEELDSDGSWGGTTYTRIINSITQQGWDNINNNWVSLPATTFDYTLLHHLKWSQSNCMLYKYLTTVNNGYGGHIEFDYISDGRGYWSTSSKILKSAEQYVVNSMTQYDGINEAVTTTYTYQDRCYDQDNQICQQPDTEAEYGIIAGHGQVTVTTHDFENIPLTRQILHFHNEVAKQGKVYYQKSGVVKNGNFIVSQSTNTTYEDDPFGNNVRFVHPEEVVSTQYDDGLGTPSISTRTVYEYDTGLQKDIEANKLQLGQLTTISEFDENDALIRTTKRWYRVNNSEGNWVIKHVQENIYEGPLVSPVLYTWMYYDNQSRDAGSPLLTRGSVTRVRQLLADENLLCTASEIADLGGGGTGCTHAFRTVDQTYGYDDFGNVKTQTTYAGYGYQTQRIGGADPNNYNLADYPPNTNSGYNTTTIEYDSTHIYPVKTIVTGTDISIPLITQFEIYGFNSTLDGFQTQPGLLKKVTGPNTTTQIYEYDPFGRLWASYDSEADRLVLEDPSDGYPAVRYRYFDNLWNSSDVVFLDPAGNEHDRPTPFMTAELIRPGDFPNPAQNNFEGFGYTTQTYYDGFGRPIQTRALWTEVENEVGHILPQQEIITIQEYDALGQTVCSTTPFSVPRYDQRGVTYGTSPFVDEACKTESHSYTLTEYDGLGRPTEVIPPSGVEDSTNYDYKIKDSITVESFTKLNYVQVVDANKHVVNSFYNSRGELVQVREYSGTGSSGSDPYDDYAYTTYSYDLRGNLIKVMSTPPSVDRFTSPDPSTAFFTTNMQYDALGRKTSMDDPDMGHWEYIYDAAGNLREQYDTKGNRLCFYYDGLNRLTDKTKTTDPQCSDAPVPQSNSDWLASYSYDKPSANAEGQLSEVKWTLDGGVSSETFEYNDQGQLVTHTRIINGRPYQMSTLEFDALYRPTKIQYPNGEIVEIGYDHEGENSLKAGTDELVTDVRYNNHGQITTLARGSSSPTTTYEYFDKDDNFRLERIQHGGNLSDELPDFAYLYDSVGNITKLTTTVSNSNDVQDFGYDHLNRLINVSTAYNHSYGYDEIGNLIQRGLGDEQELINYSYTDWDDHCPVNNRPSQSLPHAVKKMGDDYFCYDDNGNMVTRFDKGTVYTQDFDAENRLSSVEKTDEGTTTFFYDASGQRVMTAKPNGVIVYTPFPNYEEEIHVETPGVSLRANNETETLFIKPNTSFTLSWSSFNTSICDLSWSSSQETSGSEVVSSLSIGTYTYSANCQNMAGVTSNANVTVIVKPEPTITITANNQTSLDISPNTPFSLAWSSDANSCSASGNWSEPIGVSGNKTKTSGVVGTTQTYTITCSNEVGSTTKDAMVFVQALPQASYLKANNQTPTLYIKPNTAFTLSWGSVNANNCTASSSWSGTKSVTGSQSISGFSSGTRTYAISCSNNVGTSSTETVTVVVVQNPTVTLSANLSSVVSGDPLQLTWSSSSSQSCSASWTSSTATNGSKTVYPTGEGPKTYTITCTNLVGVSRTASRSVTVIAGNDLTAVDRYINNGGPCAGKNPKSCQFDTRVVYYNSQGDKYETITAYGKYWNFTNGVAQSGNGSNLTNVPRYTSSNGPCAGKSGSNCVLDSRHIYYDASGNKIETITAYGRYYNYTNGTAVSSNGGTLTSISRYSSGPCAGKSGTSCKFDSRTIFYHTNGHRTESIYAYGRYYNFDLDNSKTPWSSNGSYSTGISRYTKTDGTGACAEKTSSLCTFDTRTIYVTSTGETIESISAYGKYYNYVNQNGTWVPWGMPVANATTSTTLVAQTSPFDPIVDHSSDLMQSLPSTKPRHLSRITNEIAAGTQVVIQRSTYAIAGQTIAVREVTLHYDTLPEPTVTLSADLPGGVAGDALQLSWTSDESQICFADWTGSTATSGSQSVVLSGEGSQTFSITCINQAGESASDDVSVSVIASNDLVTVDRYVNDGGPCAEKAPSSCQFDTRVVYFNAQGDKHETITAYGKYWNFINGVAQSGNGTNLTEVERYHASNGPCANLTADNCTFDSRHIYYDANGNKIETITANDKYYNYENGIAVSSNGSLITSVSRYASGPCSGQSGTNCKFDDRTIYAIGSGHRIESIYAYGGYWNFDLDDGKAPWSSNGSYSTDEPRYTKTDGTGPCAGKIDDGCTFDSRTMYLTGTGETVESISAYGKYYNYIHQNGTWVPWGMPTADASTSRIFMAQVKPVEGALNLTQPLFQAKPHHLSRISNASAIALPNNMIQSSQLFFIYSDHLGSASAIQHPDGTVEQARYLPFGGWRDKPDNLPGSRGYTGHVMNNLGGGADDLGLIYMNARYYVPNTNRFLTPDSIVPNPTDPQSYNRYTYVNNNPLRFTDPTGHFTKDEIMASLTDQYGEDEANRIWDLWLLDEPWMNALADAELGSTIWASMYGYGTFEATANSSRISIRWLDESFVGHNLDLWAFQGKGGYQVRTLEGYVPDNMCNNGFYCSQAVFKYDSEGQIIGESPIQTRYVEFEANLFGMSYAWFDETADIRPAPWSYTQPWLVDSISTVAGWFNPGLDMANDITHLSSPLFPLTVAAGVDGWFGPSPINLEPNDFTLPEEFRP